MKSGSLFFSLFVIITACQSGHEKMQTTASGVRFQIFHLNEKGKIAPMMSTAKVIVHILDNSKVDGGVTPAKERPSIILPHYQMVLPPAPFTSDPLAEIMVTVGVRDGDSIVTITKDNRKTAYAVRHVYIPGENGLNTDSVIAVDKNRELKEYTAKHAEIAGKRIADYLQKNNINATKTGDNVFVEMVKEGNGPRADSGQRVGIHFNIRNLYTGKLINSNTDTSFHQPPVLEYQLLQGFMLKQVDRVVMQLPKGGKANIYIPGVIAIGPKASDPRADLDQDMVFEIEVVSVK